MTTSKDVRPGKEVGHTWGNTDISLSFPFCEKPAAMLLSNLDGPFWMYNPMGTVLSCIP